MKKFIPLLLIALFFSIQLINAQNAPISTIGIIETYGTTIVVPITVTGFTEIGGCDLLLNYDPAVATATSVALGPGIGQFFFSADIETPGIISVSWLFFQPNVPGVTLPDNSAFLNITFERANYGYSAIEFDNSLPDNCLYADGNFDELNDIPNVDYYFDGSVTFASEGMLLSLKAFLEGPYNPSTNELNTDINNILPLSQPFDPPLPYYGNPLPDWYYTGVASVGVIPNTFVVDWVLLQLRDATSAATATSATAFETIPAFILNTGEIVDLDGLSPISFLGSVVNDLFVVVWHRNHLGIMSANALVESGGNYSYDFSSSASQVYGGTSGHKELEPGVWGMVSADGDGDGSILPSDITSVWLIEVNTSGYLGGDFNMNGIIQPGDKTNYWIPNANKANQTPGVKGESIMGYQSQVPK